MRSGLSQKDAGNALAVTLGGHVKHKKFAEGGVKSGMNQGDAKNALAGLFGAKKTSTKKPSLSSGGGGGGVDSGPSQADAAAALGGLFAKKENPPKSAGLSRIRLSVPIEITEYTFTET